MLRGSSPKEEGHLMSLKLGGAAPPFVIYVKGGEKLGS